jgi:hypothetical protein
VGLDFEKLFEKREIEEQEERILNSMVLPTPGNKPGPFGQGAAAPTATAPRPGVPIPGAGVSSAGKIQLAQSLEGVEKSSPLVAGQWPAYVEYVEEITASTGSQGIRFHLRFLTFPGVASENPNDGRKGRHDVYVTPKAMWKVKNTFCAVGQCDAVTEFDANEAANVLVLVDVTKDSYTPNPTELNPNPKEVETSKCDTIREWPDHLGGAGTKYSGPSA